MIATKVLKLLEDNSGLKITDAWNLRFERPADNSKEEIEWLCATIDRILVKVENHENFDDFVKQGNKIKKYIKKTGFDSATQLVVVLS